jgi:hypothetical protein
MSCHYDSFMHLRMSLHCPLKDYVGGASYLHFPNCCSMTASPKSGFDHCPAPLFLLKESNWPDQIAIPPLRHPDPLKLMGTIT